jgi:hypothetical protein
MPCGDYNSKPLMPGGFPPVEPGVRIGSPNDPAENSDLHLPDALIRNHWGCSRKSVQRLYFLCRRRASVPAFVPIGRIRSSRRDIENSPDVKRWY